MESLTSRLATCLVLTLRVVCTSPANGQTFADRTGELSLAISAGTGASWGDYDLDGDPDLVISGSGIPVRLYRNDDGKFLDVTNAVRLDLSPESSAALWGDHDGDGDPELMVFGLGQPSALFEYSGEDERFIDISERVGLQILQIGDAGAWIDFDMDGDLDLYVARFEGPNRLYRNLRVDEGRAFEEVAESAGVASIEPTLSVAWGDYDSDGDADLYLANFGRPNQLYRNSEGVFVGPL